MSDDPAFHRPRGKPWQSKLEPFYELIAALRRRHTSYVEIAATLGREHGMTVDPTTVHSFVRARARRPRGLYVLPDRRPASEPEPPVLAQRTQPAGHHAPARGKRHPLPLPPARARNHDPLNLGGLDVGEDDPHADNPFLMQHKPKAPKT